MKKLFCAFLIFSLSAQGIFAAQNSNFYAEFEKYFNFLKKPLNYDFKDMKSPFANQIFQNLQKLEIQAIFPQKIKINNQWLKIGDKINEAKVKEITQNSAILEYDGEIILLKTKENVKISIK